MRRTNGNGNANGSPGIGSKRVTRLQVMLAPDELRALDTFRFNKRMPSRAAAVREILRRGLAALGFEVADDDARSREFGVLKDSTRSGRLSQR